MKFVVVYTLGDSSKTLPYNDDTTFETLIENFMELIDLVDHPEDFRFFLHTRSLRCLIDPSQKVSVIVSENGIKYPADPKGPKIVLSRVFFMHPYNEDIPVPSTLHELIYNQCVYSLLSYPEWANAILAISVEECIRVSAIIAVSKYGNKLEGTGLTSNKMKENILSNIILGSKIPVMKGDSKYSSIRSLLKDSTWETQIQKAYNDVCSEVRISNPTSDYFVLSGMNMLIEYCKSHLSHYGTEFTQGDIISVNGSTTPTGEFAKYKLPLKISVGVSVNGVSFLKSHQERGSHDLISILSINYENLAGWGVEGTKLTLKGIEPSSKTVNEYVIDSISAPGILYMLMEYVNRHVAESKSKTSEGSSNVVTTLQEDQHMDVYDSDEDKEDNDSKEEEFKDFDDI